MALIFVYTANLDEIREAAAWGVLDGVTTNPTLMFKAGTANRKEQTLKIVDIVQGSVSAEVISTDAPGMIEEAREILSWSDHVYVKIPTIPEGLKAMREISSWPNGRINATLIFSANQSFLARNGASYAHDLPGPADDAGLDGMVVRQTRQVFDNWFQVRGVGGGIRNTVHITQALLAGADPHDALPCSQDDDARSLHRHRLRRFLDDWAKISAK